MVNRTPLLSRRTGAGHEVDRNIRLVPGFRFVEKLHALTAPVEACTVARMSMVPAPVGRSMTGMLWA